MSNYIKVSNISSQNQFIHIFVFWYWFTCSIKIEMERLRLHGNKLKDIDQMINKYWILFTNTYVKTIKR